MHVGKHVRIRSAQCEIVQIIDNAQTLQPRGMRQLLRDAPERTALQHQVSNFAVKLPRDVKSKLMISGRCTQALVECAISIPHLTSTGSLRMQMCHLQVEIEQLVDSQSCRQADPCWRVVDDEAVDS